MFYLFFLLAVLLSLSLLFSAFKKRSWVRWAKFFRITVVVAATCLFTYLFVSESMNHFKTDSLTVQVANKLPFPLDFYIIKVNNNDADVDQRYETRHLGNIRPNFYRIEYLRMPTSDEFWVIGYLGKSKLAYFSQHAIPNKNEDQIIEVNSYIIQSSKLSDVAKRNIDQLKFENVKTAVWIALDLLLLFLNLALLVRKKK